MKIDRFVLERLGDAAHLEVDGYISEDKMHKLVELLYAEESSFSFPNTACYPLEDSEAQISAFLQKGQRIGGKLYAH